MDIPKGWENLDLNDEFIPHFDRIGDLKLHGRYHHRGIPFKLNMSKKDYYYLELEYWHPYNNEWINIGEISVIAPLVDIPRILKPIFDVIIGVKMRFKY